MSNEQIMLQLMLIECENLAKEISHTILLGSQFVEKGECMTAADRLRSAYLNVVGMFRVISDKKIAMSVSVAESQAAATQQAEWVKKNLERIAAIQNGEEVS